MAEAIDINWTCILPTRFYIPGDIVYSPGVTEAYEIVSYPVCRLYHDPNAQFQFQPNAFEFNKKYKTEGNHLSYLARLVYSKSETFYITDNKLFKKTR